MELSPDSKISSPGKISDFETDGQDLSSYSGCIWVHKETGQKVIIRRKIKKYLSKYEIKQKAQYIYMWRELQHSFLPKQYGILEDKEHIYFVSEFLEGPTLEEYLDENVIDEQKAAKFSFQLANLTLYFQKRGIIGQTRSPSCFKVDKNGNLKIKSIESHKLYKEDEINICSIDNWDYLCPDTGDRSFKSILKREIFILGSIIYRILVGDPPFVGGSLREWEEKVNRWELHLPDNLSKDAKDLLRRTIVKNPDERLTIDEVLDHQWFKNLDLSNEGKDEQKEMRSEILEILALKYDTTVENIESIIDKKPYHDVSITFKIILNHYQTTLPSENP